MSSASDQQLIERLARHGATASTPAIAVDVRGAIAQGRRRRRNGAAAWTVLAAVAVLAGVAVPVLLLDHGSVEPGTATLPPHPPPVETSPAPVPPSPDPRNEPSLDDRHIDDNAEENTLLYQAGWMLDPLIKQYPDVYGFSRWVPERSVLEVGAVTDGDRAAEFRAAVERLSPPAGLEFEVVPSQLPLEVVSEAAQRLSATSGEWAPGLSLLGIRADAERGLLVMLVDESQVEEWTAHLADVDLGVPAIAEPGGRVVLQGSP